MRMVQYLWLTTYTVHKRVKTLLENIKKHLESSLKGSVLQNGIKTVLLGAPNVGKSSLLNILARKDASIVSPEPGTTRDVVEILLDIAGFPCIVSDTAGLREGKDVGSVEKEGVARAKRQAEASDLKLLVVDANLEIKRSLYELLPHLKEHNNVTTVVVLNKIDLLGSTSDDLKKTYSEITGLSKDSIFPVSCITQAGFEDFGNGMSRILKSMTGSVENVLATNERQRKLLQETIDHLKNFLGNSCLALEILT
jgi:tRNA modification GTPase